jgi:hypothetical protein
MRDSSDLIVMSAATLILLVSLCRTLIVRSCVLFEGATFSLAVAVPVLETFFATALSTTLTSFGVLELAASLAASFHAASACPNATATWLL